ncbi:MAG: hypothetical protein ACPG32_15570, partial [Akkermansiaceae bacterium]
MIQEFNRSQLIYGILRVMLSVFLFVLMYGFFSIVGKFVTERFELEISAASLQLLAILCTVTVAVCGYLRWKNGQGHFSAAEALVSNQLDESYGGALAVQRHTDRTTGISYLLTSLFIAAPIQALKAWEHFQARIPHSLQLEQKLTDFLEELHRVNKWQDVLTYPGKEQE